MTVQPKLWPPVLRGPFQAYQGGGVDLGGAGGARNLADDGRPLLETTWKLDIGTLNTRTLSKDYQVDFLLQELGNIKMDILTVCETKRRTELTARWSDGTQVFLGAASNNAKVGGVGFIVRPNLTEKIISCSIINERLGKLVIKSGKKSTLKIIVCYAPTSKSSSEDLEFFYEQLEETLKHKTTYTMMCGDLNAKLGVGTNGGRYIGPFGSGIRNERGDRLAEFTEAENFYVMNSFFRKRIGKRWTWQSPDGNTKNEIDYIMTDCKRIIQNVETIGRKYFDIYSDHRPLRATVIINEKQEERARTISNHKKQPKDLNPIVFQENINITDWKLMDDIDKDYKDFLGKLKDCKATAETLRVQQKRERLSPETMELLKLRRELKDTGTKNPNYKFICKLLRKRIKEDYEKYRKGRLQEAAKNRTSLKKVNKELCLKQTIPSAFIDNDGIRQSSRKEMQNIIQIFYNDLYEKKEEIIAPLLDNTEEVPPILPEEIEHALQQMKKGKTTGMDTIKIEDIFKGGPALFQALAERFTWYIKEGKVPTEWKTSKTILIFKKGNIEDIRNYRPICLLSHLYKILTRVILNRIQTTLEENNRREQAGFRKGFSTIDHIHVLAQLTERFREYQIPLCLLFIDFKKAFDTIEHNAVISALHDQGIEHAYINLIQNIYSNGTTQITLFNDPININLQRGVRQGDVISPNLFTSTLENILRKINLKGGIKIDGEKLQILAFADDIVLLAHTPKELEISLNKLNQNCQKIGLTIHPDKTKWMKNEYCKNSIIKLNNKLIEEVGSYIYLGQSIQMNNDIMQEIIRRKKAAWISFNNIKTTITDPEIDIKIRSNLFNSHILPSLTYGSETWNITKKEEESLRTTQRAIERRIYSISKLEHIRHTKIRKISRIKDVQETIYENKRRWADHIARMKDNRWTTRVTDWYPRTKKRKLG